MLKGSREKGYPYLFPDLSGKVGFLTIKYDVSGRFLTDILIELRKFPSSPSLLTAFIINGCWILTNVFSASLDIIM